MFLKSIAENRQLTELLNNKDRRFLAVTNVEIYAKILTNRQKDMNF